MATQAQKDREEEVYYATHFCGLDSLPICGTRFAQHLTSKKDCVTCPDCATELVRIDIHKRAEQSTGKKTGADTTMTQLYKRIEELEYDYHEAYDHGYANGRSDEADLKTRQIENASKWERAYERLHPHPKSRHWLA